VRAPFLERGLAGLARVIRAGYTQWETARGGGPLGRLDARAKALCLAVTVVSVSLDRDVTTLLALGLLLAALAAFSRVGFFSFCRRALAAGFLFGFVIAFPSALNFITDGKIVVPLLSLERPHDIWLFHVPAQVGLTREGLMGVATLTLRVVDSVAASLLVISTTPLPELVRALKALRVPDAFLMIMALAVKYIFSLAQTASEMHLAKKARLAGGPASSEARSWAAGRMALLLRKATAGYLEVSKAMSARGFTGEVRVLERGRLRPLDLAAVAAAALVGGLMIWL